MLQIEESRLAHGANPLAGSASLNQISIALGSGYFSRWPYEVGDESAAEEVRSAAQALARTVIPALTLSQQAVPDR
jgi:hypothetical protein